MLFVDCQRCGTTFRTFPHRLALGLGKYCCLPCYHHKTPNERFDKKYLAVDSGCWEWQAALNRGGYGVFSANGKYTLAHRFAYERWVGSIPDGLVLDHLCRNRSCVNPHHLEPVTTKENILRGEGLTARNARKMVCKHGHPLAMSATKTGRRARSCPTCLKRSEQRYRECKKIKNQ